MFEIALPPVVATGAASIWGEVMESVGISNNDVALDTAVDS